MSFFVEMYALILTGRVGDLTEHQKIAVAGRYMKIIMEFITYWGTSFRTAATFRVPQHSL